MQAGAESPIDVVLDWSWANMASSMEVLLNLNTSCVECWEQGPPPNMILSIPPPPLPVFLQRAFNNNNNNNNNNNADPCTIQCEWNSVTGPGVEYVELPRQVVTGPVMDDTWLLVLIASCVGVLLLGALLALFLLKSRVDRSGKSGMQLDVSPPPGRPKGCSKGGCEAVLYPCPSTHGALTPDSRVLWAALTPRGTTQHFTAEPVHHKFITPLPLKSPTVQQIPTQQLIDVPAFDNSGFVDSDDPTYAEPLTPIYCEPILLNDLIEANSVTTLKRSGSPRPRVSSPTRIENPNLPPLNLHPHRTLRRSTLSRRGSDVSQSPAIL